MYELGVIINFKSAVIFFKTMLYDITQSKSQNQLAIAIGSNDCHDDGNNEEIVTIELMPGNVERQQRRPPKPVR